jgi:hypothetical protein
MSMKKLVLRVCAAIFALGIVTDANAAAVYVYDGGVGQGTWSDVNKVSVNGPPDSLLCWAAAAADVLAWTGWWGWDTATSSYLDTAAEIYGKIDAGWPNQTANATFAYEWWMTNRTASNTTGNTAFPSAGLDFYPGVNVQAGAGSVTAFVNNANSGQIYSFLDTYINGDRGIVASIDVPSGPGLSGPYSHALTVWGWDPTANQIYVTDSDDGQTALRTYSFYQSGGQVYIQNYSNLYTSATDVLITQLTRLNVNGPTRIEPNGFVVVPDPDPNPDPGVPEPASLLLLGVAGGLGAVKKAKNRFGRKTTSL